MKTIKQVIEEFLEEQKARLKPRTYGGYEDAIGLFEYYLDGYACNSHWVRRRANSLINST